MSSKRPESGRLLDMEEWTDTRHGQGHIKNIV